jgi:hypothetical protein
MVQKLDPRGVIDPTDNVCSAPECVERAYQEAILKCE